MTTGDEVFGALADPTRRKIFRMVVDEGPLSATTVSARLPISRQGVAKHLRVLRDAGLVRPRREGRETRFEATPAPLASVTEWVTAVGTAWDRRLARLAERVGADAPPGADVRRR